MTDSSKLEQSRAGIVAARAGVVLVAMIWGVNWVSVRYALRDMSPWTFRTISFTCAAVILMASAKWRGISLNVKKGPQRLHLLVAGALNIGAFGILSAFAQLSMTTSRTAICAYTMPVWATLLARPILGERLDRWRGAALVIGASGLVVLLWPAAATGFPLGTRLALGSALSWAAGTVYLKWANVEASPIAITAWQLLAGSIAVAAGLLLSGARLRTELHWTSAAGLAYTTLIGTALAYLLWFQSAVRLPASTVGLGILLVPVVGVAASILLLGDRPTAADLGGFALIFLAAVCALGPRADRARNPSFQADGPRGHHTDDAHGQEKSNERQHREWQGLHPLSRSFSAPCRKIIFDRLTALHHESQSMSPGSTVASPRSITRTSSGACLRTSAAGPTALMRSPSTYTAASLR